MPASSPRAGHSVLIAALEGSGAAALTLAVGGAAIQMAQFLHLLSAPSLGSGPSGPLILAAGFVGSAVAIARGGWGAVAFAALFVAVEPLRILISIYSFVLDCWQGVTPACGRSPKLDVLEGYMPLAIGLAIGVLAGRWILRAGPAQVCLIMFGVVSLGLQAGAFMILVGPRLTGTGEVGRGTQVAGLALPAVAAMSASLWLAREPRPWLAALIVWAALLLAIVPNVLFAGGIAAAQRGWPLDAWAGPLAGAVLVAVALGAQVPRLFRSRRIHFVAG